MRHKILKLFLDFEKEEKWLNEMSAKGLQFISYCFPRYIFEEGKPGEYTYRLELMDNLPSHIESRKYINFLEDTGVECVDTFWRWVYFRKKTADGPFDLFSDLSSKIKHYQRIIALVSVIVAVNAAIGLYNIIIMRTFNINPLPVILSIFFVVQLTRLLLSFIKKVKIMKAESAIHE
ncbi:MAG: DUF2812 domain-containing protein [Armatimonadota bacterium]